MLTMKVLGEEADLKRVTEENTRRYSRIARQRLSTLSKQLNASKQIINMTNDEFNEFVKSMLSVDDSVTAKKQRDAAEAKNVQLQTSINLLISDLSNHQNINFAQNTNDELMPQWASTDNIVSRLNDMITNDKQKNQKEGNENG